MKIRYGLLSLATTALVSGILLTASPNIAAAAPSPNSQAALSLVRNTCPTSTATSSTKNYIVRFADSATDADSNRLINLKKGQLQRRISKAFNGAIVKLTPKAARELCLLNDASLMWVEEDQDLTVAPITASVRAMTTVSATSWGLDRIDQTTGTNGSYSYITDGAGVDVYVVDTGILSTHTEFSNRVRTGFSALTGTSDTTDCNGHGTHVAGTAIGSTYGVAPLATVIPVKVLDCNGAGTISSVIAGIDWAIGDHTTTPAVMNLSLGAGKSDSLNAAVDRAFVDGITVVVAAGNSNVDACTTSPGSAKTSALTIGATTSTDARASYSNFGECLDLFAPGSAITSAWHTSTSATNTISGTSMASPHVAGLAARYLSAAPTAVPVQVMSALTSAATQNVVTSAGTLSPNLLAYGDPAVVPDAPPVIAPVNPDQITDTPGQGTAARPSLPAAPRRPKTLAGAASSWLNWSLPADGGLPLTGHVVMIYRNGTLVGRIVVDADSYHTIGQLRAGSSHTFKVAAMNALGVGPYSAESKSVIPVRTTRSYSTPQLSTIVDVAPKKPTKVRASQIKSSVDVRWNTPSNAAVSSYEVLFSQRGRVVAKAITDAVGGVRIFGLKRGIYSVQVRAVNPAGSSQRSTKTRLEFR